MPTWYAHIEDKVQREGQCQQLPQLSYKIQVVQVVARPVYQIEVTFSAPWSSVCFLRGKTGFASANRLCNLSDHLAALFHQLNATGCLGVAWGGETAIS